MRFESIEIDVPIMEYTKLRENILEMLFWRIEMLYERFR